LSEYTKQDEDVAIAKAALAGWVIEHVALKMVPGARYELRWADGTSYGSFWSRYKAAQVALFVMEHQIWGTHEPD
jgi:hypothetical protein